MRRALILALALAGCSKAQPDFAFQNTSVTLPEATAAFAPGPQGELLTANCTACHSAEMILTQPKLAKPAWEAAVAKMVKVYKAPIAEGDMPRIVDALVAVNEGAAK